VAEGAVAFTYTKCRVEDEETECAKIWNINGTSVTFVTYHVYRTVSPDETRIPIAESDRVARSAPPPLGPSGIVPRAVVATDPWGCSANPPGNVMRTNENANRSAEIRLPLEPCVTTVGRRSALIHFGKRL